MLKLSKEQINQRIKKTFEENLSSLNLYQQEHYCLRMWRINGQKKYLPAIIKSQKKVIKEWLVDIKNLKDKNYRQFKGVKLLKKFPVYKSIRRRQQKKFYLKNPEIKFLINFTWQTNKLKDFNLDKENFSLFFKKSIDFLETYHWKQIYLEGDLFKIDPSECINSIFLLKNLEITDLTKRIRSVLERNFLPLENLRKHQYHLWLYGLTHIIINASNFYQNFVSPKNYSWIFNYFSQNIDLIFKKANPDIVAEIGLCFKLCHQNKKLVKKTQEFITKRFKPTKGFIPRSGVDSLNSLEHRNTLAIMLLSDFKKLYKGPDLSNFFYE